MSNKSRHPLAPALAMSAGLALCAAATAQEAEETAPAEATVEETFASMDADGSGAVDAAEFAVFAGEGSEGQFEKIAGDDGQITLDELAGYLGGGAERPNED